MASSLAKQLSRIAAESSNSLDLKAQRVAHSQSLIFEPKVAGSQDFDTIYQLCREGFQELCQLDRRFICYGRTIFGEQSKAQERGRMSAVENDELNTVLESFLGLVGSKLLLRPAVKALDWLVRRFRIHEFNTSAFIFAFLPYHDKPIFLNALSILSSKLPPTFRFLLPYIETRKNPPRSAIVYAATTHNSFFSAFNTYTLKINRAKHGYQGYFAFWASVTTEALAGMLDQAKSGRIEVQKQNQLDVVLRILPLLSEGLSAKKAPDLRLCCYMLTTVIVSKAAFGEQLLVSLMLEIVNGWTEETVPAGLTCLSIIAQHRHAVNLPSGISTEILRVDHLGSKLATIAGHYHVDKLTLGLLQAYIDGVRANKENTGLRIMLELLQRSLVNKNTLRSGLKIILKRVQHIGDAVEDVELVEELSAFFTDVNKSEEWLGVLEEVMQEEQLSKEELEARLQIVLPGQARDDEDGDEDVEMEDSVSTHAQEFETAMNNASSLVVEDISFLDFSKSAAFDSLAQLFQLACSSSSHLEKFFDISCLEKSNAMEKPLYFSFMLRFSLGPFPSPCRAAALQAVTSALSTYPNVNNDPQALLMFILVSLADPAKSVRVAASAVLSTLRNAYIKERNAKGKHLSLPIWAADSIYGPSDSKDVTWLSTEEAIRFVELGLMPNLEEYILDGNHIFKTLAAAFGVLDEDEPASSQHPVQEMKKSLRRSVFAFLSSNVVHIQSLKVKSIMLELLHPAYRDKTAYEKSLLPCLEWWRLLNSSDILTKCQAEGVEAARVERNMTSIVSSKDNEGFQLLSKILAGDLPDGRLSLLQACFARLQHLWPTMSEELQISMATNLLDLALKSTSKTYGPDISTASMECLLAVHLDSVILKTLLQEILPSDTDNPPHPKRRRIDNDKRATTPDVLAEDLSSKIRKATFILEIIDSSNPEKYPELLRPLFDVLGLVQQFSTSTHAELAYLQTLVLTSLSAIVNTIKTNPKFKLEHSTVRPDLLVDCVRQTDTPQVHNTALLVIAGICSMAPELILHSVMPIFTFIRVSMLQQDNEFSSHVINQTMEQVIPPLVSSLRQKQTELISGVSELLLSFVSAYKHIPASRRIRLFESLVSRLGPQDFLFAVLALLANRYSEDPELPSFAVELANCFDPPTQLGAIKDYVGLIVDSYQAKRTLSETIIELSETKNQSSAKFASSLGRLLSPLLRSRKLLIRTNKLLRADGSEAVQVRDLYSQSLEQVLKVVPLVKSNEELRSMFDEVLASHLDLLRMSDFVLSVKDLLKRPDDDLRRSILRSLEARMENDKDSSRAHDLLLDFLHDLSSVAGITDNVALKHAAISCIDQIVEKYGKMNRSLVKEVAEFVVSDACLSYQDERVQVLALLCLATMVDILGPEMLPVLPIATEKAFAHWRISMVERKLQLHNAVCSFFFAIVTHLPWLVTGEHLEAFLRSSYESVLFDLGDECNENVAELFGLVAKNVEPNELFASMKKVWPSHPEKNFKVVQKHITLLSRAIDAHPKSSIMKNSQALASLFLQAFDVRRLASVQPSEAMPRSDIDEFESSVIDAFIRMVYKMNDTTFRPVFLQLIQWATTDIVSQDETAGALEKRERLLTLYIFLHRFFDTLKSIVTGYSSHILELTASVLQDTTPDGNEAGRLWIEVLATLQAAFKHDQDAYWQKPSNFSTIAPPLIASISHAGHLSHEAVSSCISALGTAADSQTHHKTLNTGLLAHFRSDSVQVRLLAVECEHALTEAMGEEWLNQLPEMLPFISEAMEDDNEEVEREVKRWITKIEDILGESISDMLQ